MKMFCTSLCLSPGGGTQNTGVGMDAPRFWLPFSGRQLYHVDPYLTEVRSFWPIFLIPRVTPPFMPTHPSSLEHVIQISTPRPSLFLACYLYRCFVAWGSLIERLFESVASSKIRVFNCIWSGSSALCLYGWLYHFGSQFSWAYIIFWPHKFEECYIILDPVWNILPNWGELCYALCMLWQTDGW